MQGWHHSRGVEREASPLGSSSAFTPPEPDMFEEKIDMPFHSSTANPEEFLVYRQPMYERFVNMLMMDGKKQTARKILWKTFGQIRDRGHNPHAVFEGALANVLPMMEMRNSKAGKGMVPYPLAPRRAEGIAMKWLVGSARKRNASGNMDDRLCNELLHLELALHLAACTRQVAAPCITEFQPESWAFHKNPWI